MDVPDKYVFCWDEIPGKDSERFIEFLIQNLGIEWVKTAKIEKIDNFKTIKVSADKNSLLLKLEDKRTEAILEIDDVRAYKFKAKMVNEKLNIYPGNAIRTIYELEDELNRREQKIGNLERQLSEREYKIDSQREELQKFQKIYSILVLKSGKRELLIKGQNQKIRQRTQKVRKQEEIRKKCKKMINVASFIVIIIIIAPSLIAHYLNYFSIAYIGVALALISLLLNILSISTRAYWDNLEKHIFKRIRKDNIGILMKYSIDAGIQKDNMEPKNEYIEIENIGYYIEDLSGWVVQNNNKERYPFPKKVLIGPGGNIRLYSWIGPNDSNGISFNWMREKPLWPENGAIIILLDKDEAEVDTIELESYLP
jgi:hypothetical protein